MLNKTPTPISKSKALKNQLVITSLKTTVFLLFKRYWQLFFLLFSKSSNYVYFHKKIINLRKMKTRRTILTIAAVLSLSITFNACSLLSGKKYKEAIEQADKHFANKQYKEAKTFYVQAQEFKPDDEYPAQRIEEIDKILKAQKIEAQYKKTITKADELFKQEAYEEARAAYVKASELKPGKNYPKEQISKIEATLAEIQAQKEFLNNPYHIVIGVFAVESNATRLNEKLLAEGYKSRIIPMYGGKYNAVTINSFPGITPAFNNLNNAKEKFQEGAWVYKK